MKCLDKLFRKNIDKVKEKISVVYENDVIKHELSEWVKYLGKDSLVDILLEIGFNEGDTVYLYSNGVSYTKFRYSVNEDNMNTDDEIKISYGAFKNRGAQISIENRNKMVSYAYKDNHKFEIDLEKIYVSDLMEYTRYYYSNTSMVFLNSNVGSKEYILKLGSISDDALFRLDNEIELEKYLCSLLLPCDLMDVFKKICEICKIDLNNYDSFYLELHKKNKRYQHESDVISHIKFIDGEFNSLSYIRDGKKINYKESGDWSYEMIDDDDLVKLSIEFKNNKVDCRINSKNEMELDDYFKDLLLYDMNVVKNEINDVKKLVKVRFEKDDKNYDR